MRETAIEVSLDIIEEVKEVFGLAFIIVADWGGISDEDGLWLGVVREEGEEQYFEYYNAAKRIYGVVE